MYTPPQRSPHDAAVGRPGSSSAFTRLGECCTVGPTV